MATREREQAPANEPRKTSLRLRAKAPKTDRKDIMSQETLSPARGILAYGGSEARRTGAKPPRRVKRGAVETPPVQSVERALSLLEAVAVSAEPVPLAQLTQVLGIDPSSVFRLANTLKRRGFLANPNGRKHYVLGPAVWRLSREYDWSRMLISICRESVKALAIRTGETAHLAVREGRQVFFIDHHACADQGVIVAGQTGKLMPLHCTAHGKALLADFGLEELKALFGTPPLERYTARTTVSLSELAKVCAGARADGYAMDDAEYLEDVRCVAAPVRDRGGLVIGSIGVSAPVTRMTQGRDAVLAQHVCDTAEHVNALLGA
jgi:IclR family acetate operon transcriptional repressor